MRSEISIIEKPPFDAHPTDAPSALAALQNSYFVAPTIHGRNVLNNYKLS
ncbi:hypothetical protein GCM10008919_12610 [Selenomonas dianae]|uniref:Uncharacterized protein n=1 Tax=Selenomonas dianae TaxID=135079 RepID=A0ABN0T361_9FIRM